MSTNVDKDQVFEFLRVASLDPTNQEALREAYWMIIYIFLMKYQGIDISESFQSGGKIRNMLKDIDARSFNFNGGFLEKTVSQTSINYGL
jgi:hypothetical protein